MTEYQKQRQQFLKGREDTICFTRDEIKTIVEILKETAAVLGARTFLRIYHRYRSTGKHIDKLFSVGNIELVITRRI